MDFIAALAHSAGGTEEEVDLARELAGLLGAAALLAVGLADVVVALAGGLTAGARRLAVSDLAAAAGRFEIAREAPKSSASWSTSPLFGGAAEAAGVERVVSTLRGREGAAGGREAMAEKEAIAEQQTKRYRRRADFELRARPSLDSASSCFN